MSLINVVTKNILKMLKVEPITNLESLQTRKF